MVVWVMFLHMSAYMFMNPDTLTSVLELRTVLSEYLDMFFSPFYNLLGFVAPYFEGNSFSEVRAQVTSERRLRPHYDHS